MGGLIWGAKQNTIWQDQHTSPIEHFLAEPLENVVIQSPVAKLSNTFTLNPGHGADVGEFLEIRYVDYAGEDIRIFQSRIVTVVGDVIRTGLPLGFPMDPVHIQTSEIVNVNMAVLGGVDSRVRFRAFPPDRLDWDITRAIIDMILTSGADDGKFGNIPALLWGVFFGFEGGRSSEYLVNVIDNGGYRSTAFDTTFTTRSGGGGDFGMVTRKTAAGVDKYGVTIRLEGRLADNFVKYVQDDLLSLVRFRTRIMGHVVDI